MACGYWRFRQIGRLASILNWNIPNPAKESCEIAATGKVPLIDASCYRQSFNAADGVFVLRIICDFDGL